MKSIHKASGGFTLIELLIVIAIIGILATIAMGGFRDAREAAMVSTTEEQLQQIHTAMTLLEGDTGEWPGHKTPYDVEVDGGANEIWDLNVASAGLTSTDGGYANWGGPYIREIPLDPWGNPYFFDTDYDIDPGAGESWAAVIGSFGPNGVGQNAYDDDDIIRVLATE